MTEPVSQQKYGRGQHPNSRANLVLWEPGVKPAVAPHTGPMVTPAMRRYAAWPLEELEELWENPPRKLTAAEAIAITTLIDALKTGSFTTGAKSRELVFSRLDGQEVGNVERTFVLIRERIIERGEKLEPLG